MTFPARRLRRLRTSGAMRELATETRLSAADLVLPIFVEEGLESRRPAGTMPGIERLPLADVTSEAQAAHDLGVRAVMLFGIPASKDELGTQASAEGGIVQRAASQLRGAFGGSLVVMADTCLCQYTESGHCGVSRDGLIDNDESLGVLAGVAVSQARAGADTVCPSAMMDGQVAAIRAALDDAGLGGVSIMSHSAKHASSFYAPFRGAAGCAPRFGDRRTYQVPYTNSREAMAELAADAEEGADILMIKPALAYLDLVAEARRRFDAPVAAYSVSGEYALIKAAAQAGLVDEQDVACEVLSSIKRAGADIIVTYMARQAAEHLGR